ncbi:MAG: hypothetical protein E7774_02285 [Bradyrhizobium sp.]|nr:MAG: hypothetical protein E7774_02285 [Bradyrhizobium sp.]
MSATPPGWSALHATAVLVGENGVLLRGPSGAGKSALALALLSTSRNRLFFFALVGDDRIFVRAEAGRLVARGVAGFAGQIERRGQGVIRVPHEREAVIRLVVDLPGRQGPAPARLPDEGELLTEILGLRLPRLAVVPALGPLDQAAVIIEVLENKT